MNIKNIFTNTLYVIGFIAFIMFVNAAMAGYFEPQYQCHYNEDTDRMHCVELHGEAAHQQWKQKQAEYAKELAALPAAYR